MKSLNTLQTLAKIGRVLSKIVFIICLVGAILCAVGGVGYLAFGDRAMQLGGTTIQGLIDSEGAPAAVMYYLIGTSLVACVLEAILSKKAERYFVHELADGTPFTMRGAQELQKVGVLSIVFSLVTAILNGVGKAIVDHMLADGVDEALETDFVSGGIGLGITLIIVAVIFRYGASLLQAKPEQTAEISE